MTDDLDPVRSVRPAATGPQPEVLSRARSELMHAIDQTPLIGADGSARRRRRHRRTVVIAAFAAASVTAAGAAAAGGLFFQQARTTTSVTCVPDKLSMHVVGAGSGDPVADCTAWWRQSYGDPVPPLNAYTTGNGVVMVAPAALGPPPSAQPLPSGFRQEPAVIQLDHELGDAARGLGQDVAVCKPVALAEPQVRAELDRLGLRDWRIDRPGDGTDRCAVPVVHAEQKVVEIITRPPFPPPPATEERPVPSGDAENDALSNDTYELRVRYGGNYHVELSRRLAAAMITGPDARCLSAADANAVVHRITAEMGFSPRLAAFFPAQEGWTAADAPDGITSCVRPTVTSGIHLDVVPAPVPNR
jgi:hypothetical protein